MRKSAPFSCRRDAVVAYLNREINDLGASIGGRIIAEKVRHSAAVAMPSWLILLRKLLIWVLR